MATKTKNLEKYKILLTKNQVLCATGEKNYDLYYILSGELLICVNQKRQITPLAYLGENEYLGELSFIDHQSRSAHVIATKPTELIRIPSAEFKTQVPRWLRRIAKNLTYKLRLADEVIQKNGIRRQNVDSMKPLSIEDQRLYYTAIECYLEETIS